MIKKMVNETKTSSRSSSQVKPPQTIQNSSIGSSSRRKVQSNQNLPQPISHNSQNYSHPSSQLPHSQSHSQSVQFKSVPKTESHPYDKELPNEQNQSFIDFNKLDVFALKRYKRHYKLRTKHNSTKSELAAAIAKHFALQNISEMETISFFVYAVKNQGASGGIGYVTAEQFLIHGAKVTLHFNTTQKTLEPLIRKYPSQTFAVQADVEDEVAVSNAIERSCQKLGSIDILIVNHGIWPTEDVLVKDMTLKQWNHTLGVNLTGTFLFIREFLKQVEKYKLKDGVSIVLIGSTAGKFGEAYHTDYAVTKSAMMIGMLRSLKNEIVKITPTGRINCVAPGWVRTPMADKAMNDPNLLYQALASSPLKKVSEPIDIANAILFLSSSKASGNITGQVIDCNAGMEGRLLNKREDFAKL